MSRHFENELERLKKRLVNVCALVETSVTLSTQAINDGDAQTAAQVIDSDSKIDKMELEVEEECLKILALYQPVAVDLRMIVAILKINNDLERIGDLAVNIAERALYLSDKQIPSTDFDFPAMASTVISMLKQSVDALIDQDIQKAYSVCALDDKVDNMNRSTYSTVESAIKKGGRDVWTLIHILSVSRNLERIADHATNIAEDVVYLISGNIVRHKIENYAERAGR